MDTGFATERLFLRRFLPTDGPGLYHYLSRPEAVAFEPYPVQTADACERIAAERTVDPDFWAVCLPDGVLIGTVYLHRDQPHPWRTWELGYVFHPDHWGRGYASEAASALVGRCFAAGAHRVHASCDPRNTASWRLLERIGFRREGHLLRAASFADDPAGRPVWKDTYLYAALEEDWALP